MINGFDEYFNEIRPGRSDFKIGTVPNPEELVSKIIKIEKDISTYKDNPIVRSSDFYSGYIDGICDSLVLDGWDPWLVHSFLHTYLIVKYTDKYLTDDRSGSWVNSLSESLNSYYDDESIELILDTCQIGHGLPN